MLKYGWSYYNRSRADLTLCYVHCVVRERDRYPLAKSERVSECVFERYVSCDRLGLLISGQVRWQHLTRATATAIYNNK